MIIMEAPLYYDAIEMGLLDKDNPAEDFYERKHLNSDLICSNFTELSDEEYYDCLRWANITLMKNYYNKQRNNTEAQINYLYETKDVTFRGFRFKGGQINENIASESFERSQLNINGKTNKKTKQTKQTKETKNWENFYTGDGNRFSQYPEMTNQNKNPKSFENYLKKKEARAAARRATKQKPLNPNETSSLYTNVH